MKKWYKVYVEWWDKENQMWQLSAVSWWKYFLMKAYGVCGPANSRTLNLGYDICHVPRKNVKYI